MNEKELDKEEIRVLLSRLSFVPSIVHSRDIFGSLRRH